MDYKPLVSIITPCYNSGQYIDRYMISILKQNYSNIQQIIVNDGSTDDTEERVFSYLHEFEKRGFLLTYVKQVNQGLGAAINAGLKKVIGTYFTWCDSDNFLSDDYVSENVNFFLKHPDYSIVRCDGNIVYNDDINTVVGRLAEGTLENKVSENLFYNCLFNNDFHFGCAMLNTNDFDKVVKNRWIYPSRYGQNWQLLLPMFYHYKTAYIDKAMFYFVVRNDSISNSVYHMSYMDLLKQNDAHKEIICHTLEDMQISEGADLMEAIITKYAQISFAICYVNKDKLRLKKEYNKLKSMNKLTTNDKLSYMEICFPFFYRVLVHFGYSN